MDDCSLQFGSGTCDLQGKWRRRESNPRPVPHQLEIWQERGARMHRCLNCPRTADIAFRAAAGYIAHLCETCVHEFALRFRECVYFVRSGAVVKIGTTSNLRQRLATLEAHSSGRIRLWHLVEGGHSVERELHRRFAADRSHGEWFRISEAITDYVGEAL